MKIKLYDKILNITTSNSNGEKYIRQKFCNDKKLANLIKTNNYFTIIQNFLISVCMSSLAAWYFNIPVFASDSKLAKIGIGCLFVNQALYIPKTLLADKSDIYNRKIEICMDDPSIKLKEERKFFL